MDLELRHGQALFGFVRRQGLTEVEAQDAVQDVLFRLWLELRAGTAIDNPRAWAYRAVYRIAMDHHRLRPGSRRSPSASSRARPSRDATDRLAVWAEVERLPERQRQVLYLRYRADLPFEEIGPTSGITPSAARSHATQAMATLRRRLAPRRCGDGRRRIEPALKSGPSDEPAYERACTSSCGGQEPATMAAPVEGTPRLQRPARIDVHRRRQSHRRATSVIAPIAAAIVVLVGAGVWLGSSRVQPDTAGSPPPVDALGRVLSSGTLRVEVTSGPPQTTSSGGAYIGFDVDVARAIADRLGVRADVAALPAAELGAKPDAWDVAFSGGVAAGPSAVTVPYYAWPSWLAVAAGSSITGPEGLAGSRVCAVTDSAGAGWLAGRPADTVSGDVPPSDVVVVGAASDDACAAAVAEGRADALVTAALLDDELGSRGLRALTVSPSLVDTRSIIIGTAAGPGDSASLAEAVEQAVVDLREAGRLTELSRGAFGGRDVTEGVR